MKKIYVLAALIGLSNVNAQVCFTPATGSPFAAGTNPHSVTNADFNGDSFKDLATANYGSNNVSILLGTGSGTFGTQTTFSVGTNPVSVTSADFNNDGFKDLATANSSSTTVSVLLGNGTGSFATATNFAVGTNPYSVMSADFTEMANLI
ncbi:MAG: FG-GAP repeat domain-containing protein [Bacteroidia bacterium]